ncbi:MAG TPA: hypothetical protein VF733_01250 [Candidatus Saccharimonadales bacterium]
MSLNNPKHAAEEQSLPEQGVPALEMLRASEWLDFDKGVVKFVNPVTQQPLEQLPTYLKDQMVKSSEFWAARSNVALQCDMEGGTVRRYPDLKSGMVQALGTALLDDGLAPDNGLLTIATKYPRYLEAKLANVPVFNTLSEGNGTPLDYLAANLLSLRLEGESFARTRVAELSAHAGMAIGIVAMYCAGRWADAQHVTSGVQAVFEEKPTLKSRIQSTIYMQLHERQMFLPGALRIIGAPPVKLNSRYLTPAFKQKFSLVQEAVETGELTRQQFERLSYLQKR